MVQALPHFRDNEMLQVLLCSFWNKDAKHRCDLVYNTAPALTQGWMQEGHQLLQRLV